MYIYIYILYIYIHEYTNICIFTRTAFFSRPGNTLFKNPYFFSICHATSEVWKKKQQSLEPKIRQCSYHISLYFVIILFYNVYTI